MKLPTTAPWGHCAAAPAATGLPQATALSRRHLLHAALGLPLGSAGTVARAQEPTVLERIQRRGSLTVALYNAMPPFHVQGTGIDAQLAGQLAQELGLRLNLLAFNAGENMADDLRNMVWKGHYLGFGPADVLLHVPVDKPLMDSQPQTLILAPYYRESVALAHAVRHVPRLDSLQDLKDHKIAVAGQTLAGWLLIGADSGAYRSQLVTHMDDGVVAAKLLLAGEVNVAAGNASELHSVLKGNPLYRVVPLPTPRAPRTAWAVGMAVKRSATDLAQALQAATNKLSQDGRLAALFAAQGVPWQPA